MKVYKILIVLVFLSIPFVSAAQEYLVGEGDVLRITVYDHPDLNTTVRISGDGTIMFPLIGEVKVAHLSVQQIIKKLGALLADGYIVDPQVSVFIEEYRSKKITVIGEVVKPGLYELSGTTTFLELLSKAGGLAKDAGNKAIIKRKITKNNKSQEEQTITIDLNRLVEMGDTSLDVNIQDGDSIYIPKAGYFYVTGEVKKPDAYKFDEGTTVLKAITMAGGFTDKAAQGRVKIIRKQDNKEKTMTNAKMDELIKPDDVIVVPESFF